MTSITFNFPENVFAALHKNPNEFAQEMRVAAAIKWYELALISQDKAAEIAGLTRAEFIQALSRYQVSPLPSGGADLASQLNQEALARIRSRPRANPLDVGLPDSTALIREDRDR
jgi:predicted HTH domain antitoxin